MQEEDGERGRERKVEEEKEFELCRVVHSPHSFDDDDDDQPPMMILNYLKKKYRVEVSSKSRRAGTG